MTRKKYSITLNSPAEAWYASFKFTAIIKAYIRYWFAFGTKSVTVTLDATDLTIYKI